MKWRMSPRFRKWLILPPLVVGIAVVVVLVTNRPELKHKAEQEESRALRVISVPAVDVIPRALGYGTAEPGQVWKAVAEVKGRVVETHPVLKPGAMVKKGEVLVRIDPTEYELAVSQLNADIAQVNAQLEELTVKETNDRASLKIEEQSLALAVREFERAKALLQRDASSAGEVDQQERNMLTQRQSVQHLHNSLDLLPHQKKALEATLAVKKARLTQAQLDVNKTVIGAPFDCRLGDLNIELDQFLAVGQFLFEAHTIALTEIEAQIPLDQLRNLIDPQHRQRVPVNMDQETVKELFDFDVCVRSRSGDFEAHWEGRVVRIREQIDPRTRTIGLVIAVDEPYQKAIPGKRPPLVQGMYCEIELRGAVRKGRVVIPRSAIHDGHVYLVDRENRLQQRKVDVAFAQSSFFCLRDGLQAEERLIVSDPTPAIDGMLVDPISDEGLQQRLIAEAMGEGRLK